MNPLTASTCAIATIAVFESDGDRVSMTTGEVVFSVYTSKGSLESSRRNKTDVSTRTTATARWVPQSRFNKSTTVAI